MSSRSRRLFVPVALLVGVAGCSDPVSVGSRDVGPDVFARPRVESCGNGLDDDANGRIDDGCPCGPGEVQACFSGSVGAAGVGTCSGGMQRCDVAVGVEWGDWGDQPCTGEVLPAAMEACDGADDDCDGAIDEGCPCTEGTERGCGEEFLIEPCRAGTQTCRMGAWSSCEGAIGPSPERCADGLDNDCDGTVDPTSLCACTPVAEVCRDGMDNDCDGETDEMECTPDWPRDAGTGSDAGVPVDANVPPPSCDDLVPATGSEWSVTATPTPDGTSVGGTGAMLDLSSVDIDAAGNVFVSGSICDGTATLAGFALSSFALVDYARLTCNAFVLALGQDGTLRWGWQPVLADNDPPPPMAGGPVSGTTAIVADGLGGAWVTGSFAGRLTIDGVTHEETTAGLGSDAFLVHLDAAGRVAEQHVVGERGTSESFSSIVLTRDGEPVVLGGSSSPLFGFGSRIVRTTGVFLARVDASGEPRWISTAELDTETSGVSPGALSLGASGEIVLAGGSNGAVTLGSTGVPSADRTRGQAWLWRMDASDGATLSVRSWQASVGYYAHATEARDMGDFIGFAGDLRGGISFDGTVLDAGMGRPEEPVSRFAMAYDASAPLWGRAFTTVPFDAFHGVDLHVDWNVCRETTAVIEGLQGSTGGVPTPPVSQADLGAGLVTVPENVLQLVQWSRDGSLAFRTERPLEAGTWRVKDAAWSPRERSVVVLTTAGSGFVTRAAIRRLAFR